MSEKLLVFNSAPQIERIFLANGQFCFVVDDAVVDPDRLVRFAKAQRQQFRSTLANGYPGVLLPAPDEVSAAVNDFFSFHMRRCFDSRRTLHMHSRLSIVTTPPRDLQPYQSICHRDSPVVDPAHSIQASLLYLFHDSALGGTSFYEPARSPAAIQQLLADVVGLPGDVFWQRYGMEPGYISASTEWFTHLGTVAPKFNRIVFYDAFMFHSSDIPEPQRLSADPTTGRLTLNGFFTSRRKAG